jgi:capsid assembly protease
MLENLISTLYGTYWAILPERLEEIAAYLHARNGGDSDKLSAMLKDFQSRASVREDRGYEQAGSVAVVPIHGTIYPRGGMNSASGATTGESIVRSVRAAMSNKDTSAIVLDINSPGGAVVGTSEAAAAVREAAMVKPVHAVANHMAASGALWIGSQATTFSAAPNAQVGSIGVVRVHEDHTAALEKAGVKITAVTTSPYKVEGAPFMAMSDATAGEWLSKAQEYHRQFVGAVAQGRRTTPDHVETHFGQGRMLLPDQARAVGMIDRAATLEEVVHSANEKAKIASRMHARVGLAGVA